MRLPYLLALLALGAALLVALVCLFQTASEALSRSW